MGEFGGGGRGGGVTGWVAGGLSLIVHTFPRVSGAREPKRGPRGACEGAGRADDASFGALAQADRTALEQRAELYIISNGDAERVAARRNEPIDVGVVEVRMEEVCGGVEVG